MVDYLNKKKFEYKTIYIKKNLVMNYIQSYIRLSASMVERSYRNKSLKYSSKIWGVF